MSNLPSPAFPKLTVIIIVRNAVTTIAHALDSLVAQHYPNLELIIWDGLSEDGTQAVINQYSSIITVFKSEKDDGAVDGLNRALLFATGDYIGILNADDEYEPGALWAVADSIIKHPDTEVVSFGMLYYTSDGKNAAKLTGHYADAKQLALTLDYVLVENPTFLLSRFIKKSLFAETGAFNPDRNLWYYSNDREWVARLAIRGCRNTIIPKALYKFTWHNKSISSNPENYGRIIEEHLLIAAMLLKRSDLNETQKATVEKWRNRQLVFGFWQMLMGRKFTKAQSFMQQGLAFGGWKFAALSVYLLARKTLKRLGLKLSGGINRGEI